MRRTCGRASTHSKRVENVEPIARKKIEKSLAMELITTENVAIMYLVRKNYYERN